ncbi:MAG: sensor domain-containing diguanylate cyclase [Endomicrobium sp.]|jgi:diguanylate cyclase (GGDEF)-like protein|nr:sensor domain-containing diguanylate cyclase [Endomicrobium sp.]
MKNNFFTNSKVKYILKTCLSITLVIFFVIWALFLHKNISVNFPMIGLPIIILCYFFKNNYATILICLTVVVTFMEIIDFVINSGEPFVVIRFQSRLVSLECIALIILYWIFEMYKNRYKKVENALVDENNNIALDIMLKKTEILKNNTEIEKMSKKIENFVNLGNIIQFFHKFSSENEMFLKIQDIAINFMEKGSWKVKKYTEDDVFAKYIRTENSTLMINDLSKDKRFNMKNSKKKSILVVPININGKVWGIIEGFSYINNFFYDEDVEKLLLFSSSISKIINNYYLYENLQALSIVDRVTGCYRQSFFKERFNEELAYAKRNKLSLTIGILDIDFFKNINDKYGHLATDSVLQQFASVLRSTFRETDILARYGGDEFSFIMTHTSPNDALKILEEIRLTIEKTKFYLPLEKFPPISLNVTASFGFVSLTQNDDNLNAEDFIKNSDKALYRAKKLGRNRIEKYNNS